MMVRQEPASQLLPVQPRGARALAQSQGENYMPNRWGRDSGHASPVTM